jgi:N-hydroxyarylamine O-acetyltransferase
MDLEAYLRRIAYEGEREPTVDVLRGLHLAHVRSVAFENSSVLRGEPIILDGTRLVSKIVDAGRGGFCYELNGAFAELLRAVGFGVELLPARTWSDARLGPPFEHLCLRVNVGGEPFLVDVGAGFSFVEPLRLVVGLEQADPNGRFRIVRPPDDAAQLEVEWLHRDGVWRPHYRFEPRAVALTEFAATCEWLRTSSESPFTIGWRCARALRDGYATLDARRLIISEAGSRETIELDDDTALARALEAWFGIRESGP